MIRALSAPLTKGDNTAATRETEAVMSEFLDAFGPLDEVRTEEQAVLDELMPEPPATSAPVEDDPFADWGKQS
jgi:hypothetical protein